MGWYPGATNREIPGYTTPLAGRRRMYLHIAVTTAASIRGWMIQSGNGATGYINHDGATEQYLDSRMRAPSALDGNPWGSAWETWDGLNPATATSTQADTGRWTDRQAERLADIAAWLHTTDGLPLVQCADSRPGSQGLAPHRLGIDPWRIPGGETWTRAAGKPCPGTARIAQIGPILARAKTIAAAVAAGRCTWLPTGPVDLAHALARTSGQPPQPAPTPPEEEMPLNGDDLVKIRDTVANVLRADEFKLSGFAPGFPGAARAAATDAIAAANLTPEIRAQADATRGAILANRTLINKTGADILAALPAAVKAALGPAPGIDTDAVGKAVIAELAKALTP